MGENTRFFLNMQMISDEMEGKYSRLRFMKGKDSQILEGVCFYRPGTKMESCYAYLARAKELEETPVPEERCSLILAGPPLRKWDDGKNTILQLPEDVDFLEVLNFCQEIFRKHIAWAQKLNRILIQEGSVDDLCRASYEYFQNPLFVHDSQMYVISCPVWRDGMIKWEKDEQSGLLITPLEELNELKTDREYLHTLTTRGADIFSADLRGYRDIYVNILDSFGSYEARLVICELETAFKPGQFAAAEYLAGLIRLTLERRGRLDKTYKRALEAMFVGMLQGKSFTDAEISRRIGQCGWKSGDRYVCVRMDAEEQEGTPGSAVSVCNYVEARVVGSRAVSMDTQICIIINLCINDHYTSDIAAILRDGLFKGGFSNVFRDIKRLPQYYRQASEALIYCRRRNDMMWSYTFDDIAMDYIADICCGEFSPRELCAFELMKLKKYDEKNHTELYKTLKTYLLKERNTVAASAALYVGRSTLFYRLRKIQEITGLDTARMAEPVQNLYLRLSIYILEHKEVE